MANKRYNESLKLIETGKLYDSEDALALVCQTAKAKFDETIEINVRLGVDSRHADQQVRGAIVLPNGTGKTVRTLVFARGDAAKAAEEAGADYVGADEYVKKITTEQVRKIAETKMPDLNAANIDTAMSMIAGTARSMGVVVED